ncbi:signal transduction histidine kinase [Candidatus Scalindua japonica]|uniref:histidine kinase n=1 Tax=Candidatus Scalindua japonica TaxID=1284222 RepID=A0A286TWG0_9BACT|nr:ATP-binding protein [Candidatus Scalindua japonica]GAX60228.1 signal transduction histidine kinase [Candidatus Scalindua japonica]
MNIKNKILSRFLFPSILTIIVLIVFCYIYSYKVVRKNTYYQLEITAEDLYNNVKIFLSGKQVFTFAFSSDGLIRNFTEEIARNNDNKIEYYTNSLNNHLVTSKKPLDPDILDIFIIDLDGMVISSTDSSILGSNVSNETYFSETIRSGSNITDIRCSSEDVHNAFFDVARIILRNGGEEPIGIIVNRYNGQCLDSAISLRKKEGSVENKRLDGLGESGEMYIVNKDKVMITGSRFIKDAMYKQVVNTEGVSEALNNRMVMTGIYSDYRNIPVLGVYKYFEEMDWVLVASKSVSEAFAPTSYLRNVAIIIGATGIIAIVLVAVFSSKGVTASLAKATEVTRRIARDDLAGPIMDYKSMDNIKKLGTLINSELNKHLKASSYNIRSIKNDDMPLFKLKRSSEEWTITFDAIPDIITIHDKNSKIVRANKAFYEEFNIDEKHLYDKKCSEIFRCTDKALHHCSITKCMRNLKPVYEEFDDPITGGIHLLLIYPLLDEEGLFQGAIRQQKNITEKKKIDLELKRAKEFSENMIETAQDAIVSISEEGIVRVWNRSAEKIFGYSRSEIIGQPITTIIPERYRKRHENGIKRFLHTGQFKFINKPFEAFGKTKEGKEIPIELSLSTQKLENKQYSFTGIIRDRTFEMNIKNELIAQAKKLKEYSLLLEEKVDVRTIELREANKKLQEKDQRKTEFLSVASHELRTPLAAVLGYAAIINNRLRDTVFPNVKTEDNKVIQSIRKVKRGLDTIILEGKRLTDLINDLLDIEKIESGEMEWKMAHVSVTELMQRAKTLTHSYFEENSCELIIDIEDELPEVVVDKNRLEQVVLNLISNAIKFTENGSITCKARKLNNEITVSVIDTGKGIPEGDHEKIFDKFKQSGTAIKGKQKGTGLGLPICKEIVKHHGGRIWVESKPGKGSTFSFTLPL